MQSRLKTRTKKNVVPNIERSRRNEGADKKGKEETGKNDISQNGKEEKKADFKDIGRKFGLKKF